MKDFLTTWAEKLVITPYMYTENIPLTATAPIN